MKKTLGTAGAHLHRAQERYKKNFDARLRRQRQRISADDHVFLRIEKKNDRDTRHKQAPIASGPYPVKAIDSKTVVIERSDGTTERVSLNRVVRAPKSSTMDEITDVLQPSTDSQLVPQQWPLQLEPGQDDLPNTGTTVPPYTANNADNIPPPPPPQETVTSDGPGPPPRLDDTQSWVIDKIVTHAYCDDSNHPHAKVGEVLYRVRWYDCTPEDDTWEPVRHLPRGKILSYHKRRKLRLPDNLDEAMTG